MEIDKPSRLSNLRVAIGRWAMHLVIGTGFIRRRLAASRATSAGLDPHLAALLRLDELAHRSTLAGRSVADVRKRVLEDTLMVDEAPPDGVRVGDHTFVGRGSDIAVRHYEPEGLPRPSPGIIYVHGGGFVTHTIASYDGFCRRLAFDGGMRVVSLDYRRAPEHPFPAALDDTCEGVRAVLENTAQLGIDPDRVAIAGDSAGGNLVAVTALRMRRDARQAQLEVPICPVTDGTCSLPSHTELGERFFLTRENLAWYYDRYAPNPAARRNPGLSPLFAGDLKGAPKTLMVVAAFDPLHDEGMAYAGKLRDNGVNVDIEVLSDMIHGFWLMTSVSPAARAHVRRLAKRIRAELYGEASDC